MEHGQGEYHSYLLRLWRTSRAGAWYASLQSTATEQVIHFSDLAALLAFLMAQTGESLPEQAGESVSGQAAESD